MTSRKAASKLDMNGKGIENLPAVPVGANDAVPKSWAANRENHEGLQLASTISDFDVQVRSNRLDQLANPTGPVSLNSQRITNLVDPSSPQDAATRAWVLSQVSALATGMTPKGTVRAVVTTNVNLASPGATLDGLTPTNGQAFLLVGQSTGSQNGPYVYNGAAVSMTRTANWDTISEATLGSYWVIYEGTQADKFALMTNDTFTLGTDTLAVIYIGAISGSTVQGLEQDLGDGASTSFTVTHNFGTRAVHATVWRNASPYDEPLVVVTHATVNTVTVEPDETWTTNQYRICVTKGV